MDKTTTGCLVIERLKPIPRMWDLGLRGGGLPPPWKNTTGPKLLQMTPLILFFFLQTTLERRKKLCTPSPQVEGLWADMP